MLPRFGVGETVLYGARPDDLQTGWQIMQVVDTGLGFYYRIRPVDGMDEVVAERDLRPVA